ncbi:MAG: SDR family oxidoreductase [Candidatus Hydrogenedentes bacterium]|nr:SDR family oxidoreductase [Candidatus Hydrogenedentota bacterium]
MSAANSVALTTAATIAVGPGTVVVLGVTSAIARALAGEFARRGHDLIVCARDSEETNAIACDLELRHGVRVVAKTFDAEAFETHAAFVDECVRDGNSSLEGVVLGFGFMEEQPVMQKDFAIARRTIDVNVNATISLCELFAAHLEPMRRGFIAGISSVAGDRGRQSNYIYGASKAAMTTYLQGLRNRLHPHGVHVITLKPGFVDTKMTWGLPLPGPLVASPERAARDMHDAIMRGKNVAYIPWFWRYIMLIIRAIPEWQFKKMKM